MTAGQFSSLPTFPLKRTGRPLSNTLISYRILKIKIIILPVVLYGCEAWSLILREECRLRVFENTILRRIFGSKRDRKRSREVSTTRSLYSSPNIDRVIQSRKLRLAGHIARIEEGTRA